MLRGSVLGAGPGRLGSEAGELTQRLRAAGAAHLAVDCLVGHSGVASVFAARDIRQRRAVTLKLVESDSAYDVGAAAFVRGIGSAEELGDPHILPPDWHTRGRGALYYVGPHVAAEPLTDHLMRSRPMRTADGLLIAADIARALDRWHTLGLAHGEIGWDMLLIQSGQVLLRPPSRVTYGYEPRRRDVQALARLCLDLLDQTAEPAVGPGRGQSLREVLLRAADQPGTSLSARRLAERLTLMAELEAMRPGAERAGPLRRLLTAVARFGKAGVS
jgi:hypothetical protein